MTKKIAGVLLDFDEVVVDSLKAHLSAWKAAYENLFYKSLNQQEVMKMSGKSANTISLALAQYAQKPLLADDLLKEKKRILNQNIKYIELMPGAREFISHLNSIQFPYGIVSNANRIFIQEVLSHLSIQVPFFFGYEDYSKPKPHPQPYLKGAEKLGFSFSDYQSIAVLEDSLHGLKAATDAFMYTVGIASQHSEEALASAGAKLTFPHIKAMNESGLLSYR